MGSMVKKLKQNLISGSSSSKKKEKRWFLDNGSNLLEELIADCNGKSIPIRSFSSDQIWKATKNFDSSCPVTSKGRHQWYKGIIEDKSYLIKKFSDHTIKRGLAQEAYNDIVLSARMSNHINFLKLLGCCFEFSFPVFVFENADYGVLTREGRIKVNGEVSILPWSARLKIAKEMANAVTYLHMAFPKITIHRYIEPRHIFLDKNWTAKLSEFSLAITLPEGKSKIQVEEVQGTLGFLDPLYQITRSVTEYTDVYSFGIFLLVLLTGKPAFGFSISDTGTCWVKIDIRRYAKDLHENGKLYEVTDPIRAMDITSGQKLQMEAYVMLALRCCKAGDLDRPKMIQVAKELKRIEKS